MTFDSSSDSPLAIDEWTVKRNKFRAPVLARGLQSASTFESKQALEKIESLGSHKTKRSNPMTFDSSSDSPVAVDEWTAKRNKLRAPLNLRLAEGFKKYRSSATVFSILRIKK